MLQMQQSISQVVDTPHFGYEWVHPGYHLTQTQPSKTAWTQDTLTAEQTLSTDSSSKVSNYEPPLLPRDMQQLYEAIEEYITKTDAPVGWLALSKAYHLHLFKNLFDLKPKFP